MYALTFLACVAFVLALLLTPVVRSLSYRLGFVDRSDHAGKLHKSQIPRLGGIAIVLSYLLAYGALSISGFTSVNIIASGIPLAARLAIPACLILVIGIVDDIRPLKPWYKFVGQFAAAGLAWQAGVHVSGFGGIPLSDWWSFPATLLWIVLCTNAINLIDGVDGLATGVGVFATATTLLAALLQPNIDLAFAVAPLLGCLLGFLRYNFNPATIFLGDSGSLVIGFVLGCCSIIWSQKSATLLGMTAPLLALFIPLLDTALSISRRFMQRRPIFGADRGHIHHRLLDRGLTPRGVALVLYGFCAIFAILALCAMYNGLQAFVIILFCAVIWIGIQQLGYFEFEIAGSMLVKGAFRRHLNTNIALYSFEKSLDIATTPDECWQIIISNARGFGFHTIHMHFAGRRFEHLSGDAMEHSWTVRIPLSKVDYLELSRKFESDSEHTVVAPFVDSMRRVLAPKILTLVSIRTVSAAG